MDLDTKIRLMKDLIKENREITIGEYWDTVNEIESVEKHMSPYLQTTAGIIQVPGYGVVIVNNKSK